LFGDGVCEKGATTRLKNGERLVEVLNAESQAHHARWVPVQEPSGLRLLGQWRGHGHPHPARTEDDRLLTAPRNERLIGPCDLFEVELLCVKCTRSLEIFNDEMQRVVPENAEAHGRENAIARCRRKAHLSTGCR
jgi:hypothetical protein